MRSHLPAVILLAAALAIATPLPTAAQQDPSEPDDDPEQAEPVVTAEQVEAPDRVVPVFPGIQRQEWSWQTPGGDPVVSQVVALAADAGHELRTVLAQDAVPGLETPQDMGRRLLPAGGVVGINGGFWLSQPVGDPNGYLARDGQLVSEPETQGGGPRGTFGIGADGQPLVDRLDGTLTLDSGDESIPVTGVNRLDRDAPFPDGPDALYLYTRAFGASVPLVDPADTERYRGPATVATLPSVTLPASGRGVVGEIGELRTQDGGSVPIPEDQVLALAYGRGGERLQALGERALVRAVVDLSTADRDRSEAWAEIAEALAAGPLIVRDGAMTSPASWETEGFSAPTHSNTRAPRSAVAVTKDDEVLLVTVDGRQPGHSAGATLVELAGFLVARGAVDAIALDGGGSTQLVVDGITRNRPSDGRARPVASGLFVFHDYTYTATERLAGAGREATAAQVARAAYPDGAAEAVLAAAGDFPDALAGGPLAARLGAPLLLTGPDELAAATRDALRDLGVSQVTLLGGPEAISPELEQQLAADGLSVRRVAGDGRLHTAAAIAQVMGATHTRVFLVSAFGFADALAAGAPGGLFGMPILLTTRDALPGPTRVALQAAAPEEVVLVGGEAVVGPEVADAVRQALGEDTPVTRLAGADRYATARAVNEWAATQGVELDASGLVIARGDTFPDALTGGPLAARRRQLLMLVTGSDVRAADAAGAYLDARADAELAWVTLLGGHAVLSSYQQWQLDQLALR